MIDEAGFIREVSSAGESAGAGERVAGAMLPGMTNLHSHAFQRSFAGQTEFGGGGRDFWTWREAMYRAAGAIDPPTLAAVTSWLGMRLLLGGYTSLTEFHYLHHQPNGQPYAARGEMAEAVVLGAGRAGIGLTLLFGIYETGGFGGAPLEPGQARFRNNADQALAMFDAARGRSGGVRFGLAPHSLRAVPPASLRAASEGMAAIDPSAPIHIHAAEQQAEIVACRAALGAAPVQWLLDNMAMSPSWCLVHATHADAEELRGVAARGAVVGLCPSTEADLGDGLFDLAEYGGRFGIGSDSNVALDAFGELRLLEYGQRLRAERRNLGAGGSAHTGVSLWAAAANGGAQACGRPVGRIAPGCRADFVVIEGSEETAHLAPDFWVDAAMFAIRDAPVRDVMVGGKWVVRERVHFGGAAIEAVYRQALSRLRETT